MIDGKGTLPAALVLLVPFCVACSAGSGGPVSGPATGGFGGDTGFGSGGSGEESGGTANGGTVSGGTANGGGSTGRPSLRIDGGSTPYPYDLNTSFSWPEAEGGAGALCQAGHYVGTYTCEVRANDAGVYALQGPVDLRLQEAQDGEFLSVSGGALTSAAGFLALSATLIGKLSCQTGAFSGTLENGQLDSGFLGTFGGSLSAQFVKNGPKLDGTWTLLGQGLFAGYVCHGPWTATWQPN